MLTIFCEEYFVGFTIATDHIGLNPLESDVFWRIFHGSREAWILEIRRMVPGVDCFLVAALATDVVNDFCVQANSLGLVRVKSRLEASMYVAKIRAEKMLAVRTK